MWPADLELINSSVAEITKPVLIQISTYSTQGGNLIDNASKVWSAGFRKAGFERLAYIPVKGLGVSGMATAVYQRGVPEKQIITMERSLRAAYDLIRSIDPSIHVTLSLRIP